MATQVTQWLLEKAGSVENLQLKTTNVDFKLEANQVLVKVQHVGLNFADIFSLLGLYEAAPKQNLVPGLEFAGVVEAIGPNTTVNPNQIKVGDKVMGVSRFGAYSSHVVLGAQYVRPVPQGWTTAQAAAFPVQALTAWYGLVELGALPRFVQRKQGKIVTTLIHSAAGGVGLLSLQILKHFNVLNGLVATVGSKDKADLLVKQFGLAPEQVIVRTTAAEFSAQLTKALTAMKATHIDLVFDSLGGDYLNPAYDKLAPGGRFVLFGAGSFMPSSGALGIFDYVGLAYKFWNRAHIDAQKMTGSNKGILGFNLLWLYEEAEYMNMMISEMMSTIKWEPAHIGKTFQFKEGKEAVKFFQSGKSTGKVVLQLE